MREASGDPRFCRFGLLRGGAIRRHARALIERFDIRGADPTTRTRALSGGNLPKVILARVPRAGPRVILANQPTRGLDVGSAPSVQEFIYAARPAGAGLATPSGDPGEPAQLSDST